MPEQAKSTTAPQTPVNKDGAPVIPKLVLPQVGETHRLPPQVLVIYGAPFAGKSMLAAKLPKPIFLSTDGNSKLQGFPTIDLPAKGGLAILNEAIELIKSSDFETVVVDTFDQVADMVAQSIINSQNLSIKKANEKQSSQDKQKQSSQGKKNYITSLSEINDMGKTWKRYSDSVANMLNALRSTGKRLALLLYNKTTKENGVEHEMMNLGGKALTKVTGMVQALVRCSYDGIEYNARVESMRIEPTEDDLKKPEWKWWVDWVNEGNIK